MSEDSREYFRRLTGVDIMGHAKYSNGRYRIKPEDLELLANELGSVDEGRAYGRWTNSFRMPLEDIRGSSGAITLDSTDWGNSVVRCLACGRPVVKVDEWGRLVTLATFDTQSMRQAVHADDRTPPCTDWVGPVLREVEKRLRQFDREGRERGLPGPLQRDPSEPIVAEVSWCRNRSTE
jgi:hypothetical protein